MWQAMFDPSMATTMLALLLPAWILGTLTGLMLPRPKWLVPSILLNLSGLKSCAVALHGLFIVRECWYRVFEAGTFRLFLKSIWLWMKGEGWTFDFPHARDPSPEKEQALSSSNVSDDSWYVTRQDLDLYKKNVASTEWEVMMEKNIPGLLVYKAWRRVLSNGKTEYKSTSIAPDSTAEEFMDFYLDDDARPLWDTMINVHEVLESGNFQDRQMVVRWIRKFPFSFISDREYVIGRRMFREPDGCLYGITKAVSGHPAHVRNPKVVSMDVFHSMWRCRSVACPWGSGKVACETVLLHHELFKIPENLARFAAKAGMWTFVHKMAQHVAPFVQERRKRCGPDEIDSRAYGSKAAAAVESRRNAKNAQRGPAVGMRTSRSVPSMGALDLGQGDSNLTSPELSMTAIPEGGFSQEEGDGASPRPLSRSGSKAKGLATLAVASSLAMIMRPRRSSGGCPSPTLESPGSAKTSKQARNKYPLNRYRRSTSEIWSK